MGYGKISQTNEYQIRPLSPVIEKEDDISEYAIYKGYLDSAFIDPAVRNIAITGNFGIGKSRFLRYYAKQKQKKYLFVSGCSFYTQGEPDVDSVEYNLLYQLLLGCKQSTEPLRKIQKGSFLLTPLFLLGTVFFLTLAPRLGSYLRELGLYYIKLSYWLHVIVYTVFFALLVADAFFLIKGSNRILKLKSISLELGGAKIEAESESPLYKNRDALIRALVESGDKIDRVVIFEDLDRLKASCCVDLFTKLWELNKLVNLCLDNTKPMRFVYVIHDELFSLASDERNSSFSTEENDSSGEMYGESAPPAAAAEEATNQESKQPAPDSYVQLKFFDYILPIVPSMSDKDAIVAAKKLIQDDDVNELITLLAPYLYDYRLLRNIANEYSVFCRIYNKRELGSLKIIKNVTVNDSTTTGTFADGTYTFTITGPNSNSSTQTITITCGGSNSVLVENLIPGTYTVTEKSSDHCQIVGINDHQVEVTSNNTSKIPTAEFTNNIKVQRGLIYGLNSFFSPGLNYLKNFFDRDFKTRCQGKSPNNIPSKKKNEILAFAIYKNLMPDDYKRIRDGKSIVFPILDEKTEDNNLPESIKLLIKSKWLNNTCLRFVGYNREELKKCIKSSFEKGNETAEQKKFWLENEPDLCCEVWETLKDKNSFIIDGVEFSFAAHALDNGNLLKIIQGCLEARKEQPANGAGVSVEDHGHAEAPATEQYAKDEETTLADESITDESPVVTNTALSSKSEQCLEECDEELLKKIHGGLGLNNEDSAFSIQNRQMVVRFLLLKGYPDFWKLVPGSNKVILSNQDKWWKLVRELDTDYIDRLIECCRDEEGNDHLLNWAKQQDSCWLSDKETDGKLYIALIEKTIV